MRSIVSHYNGRFAAARLAVCAALVILAAGCREAGTALGRGPAEARANADGFVGGLRARFGPVESAPGYDDLRIKLGRSALVPSRLFQDEAIWTSTSGETKEMLWGGRTDGARYLLGFRTNIRAPTEMGDFRRSTRLQSLGDGQYEWTSQDQLAVGPVSPGELGAALGVLLRAAERGNSATIRNEYRASLPRATEALGRLFSLDSLSLTPAPQGGTLVSIVATGHPDRIAREYPLLSRYLDGYMSPMRVEFIASDATSGRWWVASMNRNRITLRLRVHNGRLAPLEGPSRTIPDRLRLDMQMATRVRIFNVGASGLVGDLQLRREPEAKGFVVRFRREPNWNLPPLVERLVKAPLRRPFEGEGAFFAFTVSRTGGRTLLVRDYQLAVKESAIVRWIGGLGGTAVTDFRSGPERESDRFNGEFLTAFREDMRLLLR